MKNHKLILLGVVILAAISVNPLDAQTRTGSHGGARSRPGGNINHTGNRGNWANGSGSNRWRRPRYRTYSNFYFGSGFGFGGFGFGSPFGYGYPYGYGYGGYPYGYGGYSRFGNPYGYGYNDYARPVVRGEAFRGNGFVGIRVQQRLAQEGYYRGSIDGVIGNGTRRAIRSYERAHGLRVDGEIDSRLLVTMGLA